MFQKNGPTFLELVRQGLSSTDRGYDLLAPKFDLTPFRTPDVVLEAAVAQLGPEGSVDAALDVCCGTGAAMRALRPLCRRRVVGVDRSRGMLAEARRRSQDARGDAALALVRGDALALPFRATFDVVTCFGAFGHILERDEPRFVHQLAAALKPGGRFMFVTAEEVSPRQLGWWVAKGFNAAMRVRNALIKPEFIMYYLTFLLPRARALLEAEGFEVDTRRGVLPKPFHRYVVVVATKRG